MRKRIVALLIAVVLCVSLLPQTALAFGPTAWIPSHGDKIAGTGNAGFEDQYANAYEGLYVSVMPAGTIQRVVQADGTILGSKGSAEELAYNLCAWPRHTGQYDAKDRGVFVLPSSVSNTVYIDNGAPGLHPYEYTQIKADTATSIHPNLQKAAEEIWKNWVEAVGKSNGGFPASGFWAYPDETYAWSNSRTDPILSGLFALPSFGMNSTDTTAVQNFFNKKNEIIAEWMDKTPPGNGAPQPTDGLLSDDVWQMIKYVAFLEAVAQSTLSRAGSNNAVLTFDNLSQMFNDWANPSCMNVQYYVVSAQIATRSISSNLGNSGTGGMVLGSYVLASIYSAHKRTGTITYLDLVPSVNTGENITKHLIDQMTGWSMGGIQDNMFGYPYGKSVSPFRPPIAPYLVSTYVSKTNEEFTKYFEGEYSGNMVAGYYPCTGVAYWGKLLIASPPLPGNNPRVTGGVTVDPNMPELLAEAYVQLKPKAIVLPEGGGAYSETLTATWGLNLNTQWGITGQKTITEVPGFTLYSAVYAFVQAMASENNEFSAQAAHNQWAAKSWAHSKVPEPKVPSSFPTYDYNIEFRIGGRIWGPWSTRPGMAVVQAAELVQKSNGYFGSGANSSRTANMEQMNNPSAYGPTDTPADAGLRGSGYIYTTTVADAQASMGSTKVTIGDKQYTMADFFAFEQDDIYVILKLKKDMLVPFMQYLLEGNDTIYFSKDLPVSGSIGKDEEKVYGANVDGRAYIRQFPRVNRISASAEYYENDDDPNPTDTFSATWVEISGYSDLSATTVNLPKWAVTTVKTTDDDHPTYYSEVAIPHNEFKQGSFTAGAQTSNEQFNSMTGTPTFTATERAELADSEYYGIDGHYLQFYADGGSEFVVEFDGSYREDEQAVRQFIWKTGYVKCKTQIEVEAAGDNYKCPVAEGGDHCDLNCNGYEINEDGSQGAHIGGDGACDDSCVHAVHCSDHPHYMGGNFTLTVTYKGLCYIAIEKSRVWQLVEGRLEGTGGLLEQNYVKATLQNVAPGASINHAGSNTSRNGRMVYEYEPTKHDEVIFNHSLGDPSGDNPPICCSTDQKDSFEWIKQDIFEAKAPQGAYCISDYIVLHTTKGDQYINYYEYNCIDWDPGAYYILQEDGTWSTTTGGAAFGNTDPNANWRATNDFDSVVWFEHIKYKPLWELVEEPEQGSRGLGEVYWTDWKGGTSYFVKLQPEDITYGGYSGRYSDVGSKYASTGPGYGYDNGQGIDGPIKWTQTQVYKNRSTAFNPGGSGSKSYMYATSVSSSLGLTALGLVIPDYRVNGQYDFGQSYVFYKNLDDYKTAIGRLYSDVYDNLNQSKFEGQKGFVIGNVGYYDGAGEYGSKCNGIVVFNPVACKPAVIISLPEERDQRWSVSVNLTMGAKCPNDATCAFLELDCHETQFYHTIDCYTKQNATIGGRTYTWFTLKCTNPHHSYNTSGDMYLRLMKHTDGSDCNGWNCSKTSALVMQSGDTFTHAQLKSGYIVEHAGKFHLSTRPDLCTYCGQGGVINHGGVTSGNRVLSDAEKAAETGHYDAVELVCHKPCGDDSKHDHNLDDVYGPDLEVIKAAAFINLDYGFSIYYPNIGDFYGNGAAATAACTGFMGKGYYDNMDITEWVARKWIVFPWDVEYEGKSYIAGEKIYLRVPEVFFDFYCVLENSEMASAEVEFGIEAINDPNKNWLESSKNEFQNRKYYQPAQNHLHDANKIYVVDVVGRIGALTMNDVGDFRYSNFFKMTMQGWMVPNVIRYVDYSKQSNLLVDHIDIRGIPLAETYNPLGWEDDPEQGIVYEWVGVVTNTYGTWDEHEARRYVNLWRFPLTPNYLRMELAASKPYASKQQALATQPVRVGYDGYMDFSTIGNYYGYTTTEFSNYCFVSPHYFKLNLDTGKIDAVDVYMLDKNEYKLINSTYETMMLQKNTPLVESVNLNWIEEAPRRNYFAQEILQTDDVYTTFDVGRPEGAKWYYGTYDTLNLLGRNRTSIGTENTYGILTDPDQKFNDLRYNLQGARWHMNIGLPSSSVFVFAGDEPTQENIDRCITNPSRNVILVTLEIYAFGDVWNLIYDGTHMNSLFTVLPEDDPYGPRGEDPEHPTDPDPSWKLIKYPIKPGQPVDPDNTPEDWPEMPIVEILSIDKSSADDLNVAGTH